MQETASRLIKTQESLQGEQADRLADLFDRQAGKLIYDLSNQDARHSRDISLPDKAQPKKVPFKSHDRTKRRGMTRAEIAEREASRRERKEGQQARKERQAGKVRAVKALKEKGLAPVALNEEGFTDVDKSDEDVPAATAPARLGHARKRNLSQVTVAFNPTTPQRRRRASSTPLSSPKEVDLTQEESSEASDLDDHMMNLAADAAEVARKAAYELATEQEAQDATDKAADKVGELMGGGRPRRKCTMKRFDGDPLGWRHYVSKEDL